MASVRDKLFKGVVWNSFNQVGSQLLNLIFTFALANMLAPTAFGIIGNITLIFSLGQTLFDFGVTGFLLSEKEIDRNTYNNAFWLLTIISLILYCCIFIISPVFVTWYEDGEMVRSGVRIVFLIFLLNPFFTIAMAREMKELRYNKITLINLISTTVAGIIAIISFIIGFERYSLLIQFTVKNLIDFIAIAFVVKWFPSGFLCIRKILTILKGSRSYLANSILNVMLANVDYILVGKFLGSSLMGLYTMSFRIAKYPMVKFFEVVGKMLFPTFVLLKEKNNEENYFKITAVAGYMLVPVLVYVFFTIDYISQILLKPQWNDIIGIIRILLFYTVFDVLAVADKEVLKAYNKVNEINKYRLITLTIYIGCGLLIIKRYELIGIAHLYGIIQLINILAVRYHLNKILKINFFKAIKKICYVIFEFSTLVITSIVIKIILSNLNISLYYKIIIFSIFFGAVFLVMTVARRIVNIKTKSLDLERIVW